MTTEKVIWCTRKHAVLHNFLATADSMALLLQWVLLWCARVT